MTVPGYKICSKVGEGSYGVVYQARRLGQCTQQIVALKRVEVERSVSRRERIQNEVRNLCRIRHPNLVEGYSYVEVTGCFYIIMEYVPGPNLRDLVIRFGKLNMGDALRVFGQIMLGIEHLHARAIAHGDIKLANFILRPDGVVKVCDLGLSRTVVNVDGELIECSKFHGCKSACSPEVCCFIIINNYSCCVCRLNCFRHTL